MKASAQNVLGSLALGEDIRPALNTLLSSVNTFVFNNFIPMVGTIIKGLPTIIYAFINQAIPLLVAKIITLITKLAGNLSNLANSLTAEKVQKWATTTGANLIRRGAELIGRLASSLINNLPKIVAAIGKIAWAIVSGLGSAIWPKITEAANNIKERFLAPIEALRDKISGIVDAIKAFFSFDISAPHIPLPHFSISPAGWKLGDLLKGQLPSLGISWYAKGGIADKPIIGMGEAGPEAIVPLDPFWKKLDQMAESTGNEVIINVYPSSGMDEKAIAEAVERRFIDAQKRRRLAWG